MRRRVLGCVLVGRGQQLGAPALRLGLAVQLDDCALVVFAVLGLLVLPHGGDVDILLEAALALVEVSLDGCFRGCLLAAADVVLIFYHCGWGCEFLL